VGVIEKRELIQLVSGTTGFQALKFSLNPGLAATMPLGAPEAKNWTEWKCTSFQLDFIPTVSEFATQGQQGEVAIAVDYNADNNVPTAMNQIEAMHFAGGGIPSKGFTFRAKTKLMNKSDPKYVRFGAPPAGDDLRLYDGGNLYFATSGCTNATQIGKLEVTYRFEMGLPTLLNVGAGAAGTSTSSFFQSSAAEATGATGVATNLLAATAVSNVNTQVVNTAGSFVPTAGNWSVSAEVTIGATGNPTKYEFNMLKNAATVFAGATLHPTWTMVGAIDVTTQQLVISQLVSANGADAFTFPCTQTSGTAANIWGSVKWTPA